MLRRTVLAAPMILAASAVRAADWVPKQPIKILVGYAPGGSTDVTARIIGQALSERHVRRQGECHGGRRATENEPDGGAVRARHLRPRGRGEDGAE